MNPSGTTKKRVTLAELDQHVSSAGARRPRARARASAAALGADVLAQIDLMRGRAAQSRKRGIAALVEQPRCRTSKPHSTVRAYDLGAPIRLGPASSAFSVPFGTTGSAWRTFTYRDEDDAITTGFAVEVFEDEAARQVMPAPPSSPVLPADASPVAVQPIAPPPEPATPPPVPTEVPIASALSAGQREDGFLGLDLSSAAANDREDAEQFEREIQAILSGKTARPAPPTTAMAAAPARPEDAAPAAPRPHDIFEQMGQNMAYATAFNLPPMELGRRFDEMEREIALEEREQARRPDDRVSLELSDDEISASLGMAPAAKDGAPVSKEPAPIGTQPPTLIAGPAVAEAPPPPGLSAITAPVATTPPIALPPATTLTPASAPPAEIKNGSEAQPIAVKTDTPPRTSDVAQTAPPPVTDGPPADNGRSKS